MSFGRRPAGLLSARRGPGFDDLDRAHLAASRRACAALYVCWSAATDWS